LLGDQALFNPPPRLSRCDAHSARRDVAPRPIHPRRTAQIHVSSSRQAKPRAPCSALPQVNPEPCRTRPGAIVGSSPSAVEASEPRRPAIEGVKASLVGSPPARALRRNARSPLQAPARDHFQHMSPSLPLSSDKSFPAVPSSSARASASKWQRKLAHLARLQPGVQPHPRPHALCSSRHSPTCASSRSRSPPRLHATPPCCPGNLQQNRAKPKKNKTPNRFRRVLHVS